MANRTITLDYEEYREMKEELEFLDALRSAGVDNWEGYDFAQEIYQTFKERNTHD